MRLTETQRRFREQMKEIKKNESSPYDNSRNGNPFVTKSVGGISGLVLIVILVFTFNKLVIKPFNPSNVTQPTISPGTYSSAVNGRGVPAPEARLLSELWDSRNEISSNWVEINRYHQALWENRDIERYRKDLIKQIMTCDKWLLKFENMDNNSLFTPVVDLVKEYTINSRMSCKYYLDYLNNNQSTDLQLANNYLDSANQMTQKVQPKFIEILNQKNYNFELSNNGVRYSVEKY